MTSPDYSSHNKDYTLSPPPSAQKTEKPQETSDSTAIIHASKNPVLETAKTENVAKEALSQPETTEPKALSEREVIEMDPAQLLTGSTKDEKLLEKFQTYKTKEDYNLTAEQMTQALKTALTRINDRIQLNEHRRGQIKESPAEKENITKKIKDTEGFIQSKMENLLISSKNIAEVYKEKGELPAELKKQLEVIEKLGNELKTPASKEPSIEQKSQAPLENKRRSLSLRRVTGVFQHALRGTKTVSPTTSSTISLKPEAKIGDQLNELKMLLPQLQKPNTRLMVTNGKLQVKTFTLGGMRLNRFTSDAKNTASASVSDHLKNMANSALQSGNSEVSQDLLNQINLIKKTDWGKKNGQDLNKISEQIVDETLSKIQSSIQGNEQLNQTFKPFFEGTRERTSTIEPAEVPFLLTGIVADQDFASSFQKYGGYAFKEEEMTKSLGLTLELIEIQSDVKLKTAMMNQLLTNCSTISDIYRENKKIDDQFQSVLPEGIHNQMTKIANAANAIKENSGNILSKKLEPIGLMQLEDLQKVPQMNTPVNQKAVKDYTNGMMDKIRSGTITDKEKKEFLKKSTDDLRVISSFYLGSISPQEFRDSAWEKRQDSAPHMVGCSKAMNWLTGKINEDIIASGSEEKTPSENQEVALRVLNTYVELMHSCIKDGNLMAGFAIFSAINSGYTLTMLTRMKNQNVFNLSENKIWEEADSLFSLFDNRKNLRSHIEKLSDENKPVLVPLFIILSDLILGSEGKMSGGKLDLFTKLLDPFNKIKPEVPNSLPPLQTNILEIGLPKLESELQAEVESEKLGADSKTIKDSINTKLLNYIIPRK